MGKNGYEIADKIIAKGFEILFQLIKKGFKKMFEKEIDVKNELWRKIFEGYKICDSFGNCPVLKNISGNVGKNKKTLDMTNEKYTFISRVTFKNIIKHKEQLETHFNRELEIIPTSLNSFEIMKKDILAKKQQEIEKILSGLGVEAKLIQKQESKLSTIFKISVDNFTKLESMKKEIAFKLHVDENKLRIVADKGVCKIIVKKPTCLIKFNDLYEENKHKIFNMSLPVVYGVDENDNVVVEDMKNTLNMIVAGSTGFGKSVFIHSLIITLLKSESNSLLYTFDPKGNELYDYANHKQIVFTDDKDQMLVYLKSIDKVMRDRNMEMRGKAKNIGEWNKTQAKKWPWIVIIIDEIADIMVESDEFKNRANEIRILITKLSQMGRSAGIRLVLCTQKPNKEIIDTLIKANCITRVAFKVSNSMESRIILDKEEAQNLKKPGEMIALVNSEYKHIKAPYMDDNEIKTLINEINEIK